VPRAVLALKHEAVELMLTFSNSAIRDQLDGEYDDDGLGAAICRACAIVAMFVCGVGLLVYWAVY
jgi:hypothetical protein